MNFVKAFEILLSHYSDIVALVAIAENLYPASGAGADKLKWVHDQLAANTDIAAKLAGGDFGSLWPYLEKAITLIVGMVLKKVA